MFTKAYLFAFPFFLFLFFFTTHISAATINCPTGETLLYDKCLNILKNYGQRSIQDITEDTVTKDKIYHASGLVVDTYSSPNKLYVVDKGNSRILGYSDVNSTTVPDIVIGQPSFISARCNGDSNIGIYNVTDNKNLCLIPYPTPPNVQEMWGRINIDVDHFGNLYVIDLYNNRILIFNAPFSANKLNGKGDTIADYVIGQSDFNINRIVSASNSDLNLFKGRWGTASSGVSVDGNLNVWVPDAQNHRVLRFAPGSKNANLVLGKNNFTDNVEKICEIPIKDAPLDQMCLPTLAKIDPDTGKLWVIDEITGDFRARLLVFSPPFYNGMSADKYILPKQGDFEGWDYTFQATGLTFNKFKQGKYANGRVWITEHIANRVILIDDSGNIIESIGTEDLNKRGCNYEYYGFCKGSSAIFDNYSACWSGGSVGIDENNNIYLADEQFHRVEIFSLPYIRKEKNGKMCVPNPVGGLYLGTSPNSVSAYGTKTSLGTIIFQNQLLERDEGRILVWDDYLYSQNNKAADKVVGQVDLYTRAQTSSQLSARSFNTIDKYNRLWSVNAHGKLIVYQLPIINSADPVANFVNLYWFSDPATPVDYTASSVEYDKFRDTLWITDVGNHRILRVDNYSDPNKKLLVSMVIGQDTKQGTKCNKNQDLGWLAPGPPTADSLCLPIDAEIDNYGDLYIIENNYECHGNNRIVMYLAEDINNAKGEFPGLAAKKVFNRDSLTEQSLCNYDAHDNPFSPISIAFNSRNNMVLGNDGYYFDIQARPYKQLWFYENPLKQNQVGDFIQGQLPDAFIDLRMGASGELNFDKLDNLIVEDHTWNRVWIINFDCDPDWLHAINGYTLSYVTTPNCKATADFNHDYTVNMQDVSVIASGLFFKSDTTFGLKDLIGVLDYID